MQCPPACPGVGEWLETGCPEGVPGGRYICCEQTEVEEGPLPLEPPVLVLVVSPVSLSWVFIRTGVGGNVKTVVKYK